MKKIVFTVLASLSLLSVLPQAQAQVPPGGFVRYFDTYGNACEIRNQITFTGGLVCHKVCRNGVLIIINTFYPPYNGVCM